MFAPVREGNRGGRGLFSWEDVRAMSYKDRECYLGSTVSLGFLDKGGRWRKKDWWTKGRETTDTQDLKEEIKRIKAEEEIQMKRALGIGPQKPKKTKGLTEIEYKELLKRNDLSVGIDKELMGDKVTGLGFDTSNRVFGAKGGENRLSNDAERLEGIGIDSESHKRSRKDSKKSVKKKHKRDKAKKHKDSKHSR
jgi:hypothetical protein